MILNTSMAISFARALMAELLMILIIILLMIISGVNLWLSLQNKETNNHYRIQRDSVIQLKIDSIMHSVNDFRDLYGNDRLLAEKEQKIINNYTIYNTKKNELLKNPADSVYNWTKHRLNLRTK